MFNVLWDDIPFGIQDTQIHTMNMFPVATVPYESTKNNCSLSS